MMLGRAPNSSSCRRVNCAIQTCPRYRSVFRPVCLAQPQPRKGKPQAGKLLASAASGLAAHGIGPSSLQLPLDTVPAAEPRSWTGLTKEEVAGYLSMARLHNTMPALLLVLVGAWAGAGRNPAVLANWTVWLMAFISAGVSAASMIINDYFDYASGNDQVNAPEKPLPSGLVKPDVAVLLSGSLYVAVLMGACVMENPVVRAIIAFSAGATLLYTPVFKRVTMIKNALVASVVALAPLSGALAAGASTGILQRLACPSLFAFTGIMFREVLMDCTDEPGDRAAGVTTLPVLIGAPAALFIATTVLLAGSGAAVAGLLTSHIPAVPAAAVAITTPVAAAGAAVATHSLPMTLAWPHLACVGLVGLTAAQLVILVVNVFRCNFSQESLSKAVDNCIKPMGLAIIVLAATA